MSGKGWMDADIAITGLGVVSPLAVGREATWKGLTNGESGLRRISRFDPSRICCHVGGEVIDALPPPKRVCTGYAAPNVRSVAYAVAAIDEAVDQAQVDLDEMGTRLALVTANHGTRLSLKELLEMGIAEVLARRDAGDPSPRESWSEAFEEQSIAFANRAVANAFGRGGPAIGLATACSSGAMALAEGARLLKSGLADVVIAGGFDAVLNEIEVLAFCELGALSTHNKEPSKACRPFDRTRAGMVIAEGACFVVLERGETANRRKVSVLGWLKGWGATISTNHVAASCADGSFQAASMRQAMRRAQVSPEDVDYINAHGTGTADNDPAETAAIKLALGDGAQRIPVSSTKGATGHMIAAAGAIEAAFCLLSMRDGIVPPTINLRFPDPKCDLDYVPLETRSLNVRLALSNSFGLGGSNVSLLLKAP